MLPGTEVLHEPRADPWWVGAVPALERTRVDGYADGWTFTAPVVEMPVYLRWLAGRVDALGGTVTRTNLSRLCRESTTVLVVNCAGIGSRLLAQDLTVTPVRGQVVLVEQTGLERWWLDESGPTYVVPRSRDIVVGGTDDEGDWSRTPDPGDRGPRSSRGPSRWSRSWPGRACCGTASGCARCGPRCAWNGSGTSSTATARVVRESPSPGAAPTRWPGSWRRSGSRVQVRTSVSGSPPRGSFSAGARPLATSTTRITRPTTNQISASRSARRPAR